MSITYSTHGVAVTVLGHEVTVSVGVHSAGGGYAPTASYRCRVAPGYRWLAPDRVGEALRSELTMAVARGQLLDFRRTMNDICRRNLAGPYALTAI